MLNEIQRRVLKAGLAPGTPVYTGSYKTAAPTLSVMTYSAGDYEYNAQAELEECLLPVKEKSVIWINVVGLQDTDLINKLGSHFNIHPLVIEDILNTDQRVKVEEYDDYLFLVLKKLNWNTNRQVFNTEQISMVFGPGFLISFQEQKNSVFDDIQQRIVRGKARLREYGSDYLAYSLLDTVVDQYFLVLESFGEQIENIEELIVAHPTPENAHSLYHLKRQVFMFRKAIWPLRDVINNLLKADEKLITHFTTFYLRDVYDHTIQVIDSVEIFRDMLSSMLDAYLSSLTNRMNEVMKVLAIIATLFIPLTFITGVYGMNFEFMPEVHWRWGYPITIGTMILVAIGMLIYFRRKRWF